MLQPIKWFKVSGLVVDWGTKGPRHAQKVNSLTFSSEADLAVFLLRIVREGARNLS